MYAVYNYKVGSTTSQVLADLIAILTGTTSVASLSASCVQANTAITSTVPAGWSIFDAAASATSQVIRCLDQGGSLYKYLRVDMTNALSFTMNAYETWNAGAHTGTNLASGQTTTWDASGGGYFYIYATAKNIFIAPWTTGGYQSPLLSVEYSRDIVGSTYPCFGVGVNIINFMNTGVNTLNVPRVKTANAAGDTTGATLVLGPLSITGGNNSAQFLNATDSRYRDAAENVYFYASRLGVAGYSFTTGAGGVIHGLVSDLFVGGNQLLSNLDEIVYGGKNYVAYKGGNTTAVFLIPKE